MSTSTIDSPVERATDPQVITVKVSDLLREGASAVGQARMAWADGESRCALGTIGLVAQQRGII